MLKSTEKIPVFFALTLLGCIACVISQPLQAKPVVLGWLESFYLPGERMVAKLDTGAKTSSVHAKNIEVMEKDGIPWVSFTIPSKNKAYPGVYLERPLLRETRVKEHIGKSKPRYVVGLDFCLGGKLYTAEFTLADRDNFNYRVILGRSMLQGNIIVDPAKKFTGGYTCKKMFAN
jgi:hypothetical protein